MIFTLGLRSCKASHKNGIWKHYFYLLLSDSMVGSKLSACDCPNSHRQEQEVNSARILRTNTQERDSYHRLIMKVLAGCLRWLALQLQMPFRGKWINFNPHFKSKDSLGDNWMNLAGKELCIFLSNLSLNHMWKCTAIWKPNIYLKANSDI